MSREEKHERCKRLRKRIETEKNIKETQTEKRVTWKITMIQKEDFFLNIRRKACDIERNGYWIHYQWEGKIRDE